MSVDRFHDKRFPGESEAYRRARDALLARERELRRENEEVAALRRDLPLGGKLKEDYVFEEGAADPLDRGTAVQTRFSELFGEGKRALVIYSFMYGTGSETPCPMCTALLDSLDGSAPHIGDRVSLAVVARAAIGKVSDWATSRGWRNLRLLSSADNAYNVDYFAEAPDGAQLPAINVFRRTKEGISHSYNAELFHIPPEPGQHPRHADLIWPLWNVFDLTPDGRGTDWFPKTSYD